MNAPRDPSASPARHAWDVIRHESYVAYYLESANEPGGQDNLLRVPSELASVLLCRYSRGDTIDELKEYFHHSYKRALEQAWSLGRAGHQRGVPALNREGVDSWMLLFALICFDQDGSRIRHPDEWFSQSSETVLHSMVLKGFIPDYGFRERYNVKRETIAHEQAVLRILLEPRETWSSALDAFVRGWPHLMKSRGYRDQVNDDNAPFNEFPLHAGIAVCAFDIDDSTFRDLAWYPRELVDYYRTCVRHTRDAWRTAPIDPAAGLPAAARPRLKRQPAVSGAGAYTRWLELVSGSAEQFERTRQVSGQRRTMPELPMVTEMLAGLGLAIQADIKDDATVEAQLLALCAAHRLPPLILAAPPPHGPARIKTMLAALQVHAAGQNQKMVVIDCEDDSWNVVLHAEAMAGEFEDLCEQLHVKQMPDNDWA